MALNKTAIQTTIKSMMDSYMGAAQDDTKRVAFAQAMAEAIFEVLKNQVTISGNTIVASGSSSGTWPNTGAVD